MKQIELVVLVALADGPSHGYSLAERISELTDGRIEVRPGNLYRVLDRLEERGWVRQAAAPRAGSADERRIYFSVTAAGRRTATAELDMYAALVARAPGLRGRLADA